MNPPLRSLLMQRILTRLAASLVALAVVFSAALSHAADAAAGTAKLAWELVRASGDGNAILSPASVWEALAMTHAGARGETAAEIAAVLGMPDDREPIAAAAAALRQALAAAKGEKITLDIANRIWVQEGKALEATFTGLLDANYGAAAGLVHPADAARAHQRDLYEGTLGQALQKVGHPARGLHARRRRHGRGALHARLEQAGGGQGGGGGRGRDRLRDSL